MQFSKDSNKAKAGISGSSKGHSIPMGQRLDQTPKKAQSTKAQSTKAQSTKAQSIKAQSTNQAGTSHKPMLQQDGQEQLAHPKLSVSPANSSVGNPLVSVLLASPNIFTKLKAASKVLPSSKSCSRQSITSLQQTKCKPSIHTHQQSNMQFSKDSNKAKAGISGSSKGHSIPMGQRLDQTPKKAQSTKAQSTKAQSTKAQSIKAQSTNQAGTSHKPMLQQDGQEQLTHPKLSVPSANSLVGNPSVSAFSITKYIHKTKS